jgi:hypothetical protein
MICADFLAGTTLDHGDPEMLLFSVTRFFKFLPRCSDSNSCPGWIRKLDDWKHSETPAPAVRCPLLTRTFVSGSQRGSTEDANPVAQETIVRCTTSNYEVSRARMRILRASTLEPSLVAWMFFHTLPS